MNAEWFNAAAFTENAIGTFGSAGTRRYEAAGILQRGPVSVPSASSASPKKWSASSRGSFFNVLNHAANLDLFQITNSYTNNETFTSPNFG